MQKRQKGFGAVEVVLVLVILGIIGFTGWRVYEANKEISQMPVDNSTVAKELASTLPNGYKKYMNIEHGLSFALPKDWIEQEVDGSMGGVIYRFVSPEQDKIFKDFVAAARPIDAPPSTSLRISYWKSINDPNAKGGSWIDEKVYTNLNDYFSDPYTGRPKQKIGEVTIDGQKGYEVLIGGMGQSYGVMFERDNGIYQIEFPTISEKKDLTLVDQQIVDNFKFHKPEAQ